MPATLPRPNSCPLFEFQTESEERTELNTASDNESSSMMCLTKSDTAPARGSVVPPPSESRCLHLIHRPRHSSPSSLLEQISSSLSSPSVSVREDEVKSDASPKENLGSVRPQDTVTYTLFLIRHGEAKHNVLEKAAKQRALKQARREGFADEHPETKRRMEAARVSVLDNLSLLDAPLSPGGVQEATQARDTMNRLLSHLPPPTQVLVSPLQRTLMTADILFPDHANLHVWKGIRERQTGFPPDCRASSAELLRRTESLSRSESSKAEDDDHSSARQLSFSDSFDDDESDEASGSAHNSLLCPMTRLFQNDCIMNHHTQRCSDADQDNDAFLGRPGFVPENKGMLRLRTHKLLDRLADEAATSPHRSIALVTHKGYIRELERGPLGHPKATECRNCEIRVYRVTLQLNDEGNGRLLQSAERILLD